MFDFPLPVALLVFALSATVIWIAGIRLVDATDAIDSRFGLGEALGGSILLAVATNLPEVAITISAALADNMGVVVGNILGGIAIQTVLLAVFDLAAKDRRPLSVLAAGSANLLQGLFVMAILGVCIMATQLQAGLILDRVTPGPLFIVILWLVSLVLIARHDAATNGAPPPAPTEARPESPAPRPRRPLLTFAWAAVATLIAGVMLERSGDIIARDFGIDGVLFGATFLAAATALPELSTGLRAIAGRHYRMAVSDILGGNAFLPVLFLLATLLSGRAVLPNAQRSDIYLAALAMVLTGIVAIGAVLQPGRKWLGMGPDSWALLGLYALGMAGLAFIAAP